MYLGYINSVLNPLIYDMDFKLFFNFCWLTFWSLLDLTLKSMIAFVNDEFQRSLRRAIRDFTLRRSNLNVSSMNNRLNFYQLVITVIKRYKNRRNPTTSIGIWSMDMIVATVSKFRVPRTTWYYPRIYNVEKKWLQNHAVRKIPVEDNRSFGHDEDNISICTTTTEIIDWELV